MAEFKARGWQTAPLNALEGRMLWLDWLVALPKGLAQGLESLGDFWSLANGTLERPKK